jgi:hypothetical protein
MCFSFIIVYKTSVGRIFKLELLYNVENFFTYGSIYTLQYVDIYSKQTFKKTFKTKEKHNKVDTQVKR